MRRRTAGRTYAAPPLIGSHRLLRETGMKYRALGRTGLQVSEIGFGTWGMGDWMPRDDAGAVSALCRGFDVGITFYDTALAYGDGHGEELLRKAFGGRRDQVVIASKIPPKSYHWPVRDSDRLSDTFPAEWIIRSTEQSLRNLGADYIDLQLLHAWTGAYQALPEWREALLSLKQQGKIRAFGISANDWDPYGTVDLVRSGLVDCVQVIFNIFEQRPLERLFPAAEESDTGVVVRVPFEEGLLTGVIGPGHRFAEGDWRADWLTPERISEGARRVTRLERFLAPDRPTLALLALKFVLSQPVVGSVIAGMRRLAHVDANAAASDGQLLDEETLRGLRAHAFAHGWQWPWSED